MSKPSCLPSPQQAQTLVELRRAFHMHPELGFEEERTSARVESELRALGLSPERWAKTGLVTVLEGERPGRTVMLRADMDALPVQEENTHSYRSQRPGCMHACGHDGHTAILVGVAQQLVALRGEFSGRVALVFQPAEEGRGGAQAMLEAGLLDVLRPDICGGLHLWSETPSGTVVVTEGPFMASTDRFRVTVQGEGGHGAVPHHARDPVVAAAQMIVALQTLVSRVVDPASACVVTVGQIHGGDAFNVIPGEVMFEGTVRTFSASLQDEIESRVHSLCKGVADALAVRALVEYERITIPTVNHPEACQLMRAAVSDVDGLSLGQPGFQTMAGEDMGFFLAQVPGAFVFLGAENPAVGAQFPHHHPRFEIDEAAIPQGVALLSRYALRCAQPLSSDR